MRIIAVSDSHGYGSKLVDFIEKIGDFDMLVHLGDGRKDLFQIAPLINADIVALRGNCDIFDTDVPTTRIIKLGNEKIFCCHGHTLGVKEGLTSLAREAKANGCNFALYGHTHVANDETVDGVRCMNPGSIGYPEKEFGYIELIVNESLCQAKFVKF